MNKYIEFIVPGTNIKGNGICVHMNLIYVYKKFYLFSWVQLAYSTFTWSIIDESNRSRIANAKNDI